MEKDIKNGKMEKNIQENFLMEKKMEMVKKNGLMDNLMKVNLN